MCSQDKRKQIKETLFSNDKNLSWLKKKLNQKLHRDIDVYYLLSDKSINFDIEIADAIEEIFKSEGFITSDNERFTKLNTQLFHLNEAVSHSLSVIHDTVESFFENDGKFDFNEKRKIANIVDEFESAIAAKIDHIRKVVTR